MNLALNARDAMSSGGRLTIQTANVMLDDDYVRNRVEAQAGRRSRWLKPIRRQSICW